jgi:hypothetical protein
MKPRFDAAGLQEAHDVVEAAAVKRVGYVGRIAHGENGFESGPVSHHAVFENSDGVGRVGFLGDGKTEQRQAHADKDFIAVADLPGRRSDHQLSSRVVQDTKFRVQRPESELLEPGTLSLNGSLRPC